MRGLLDRYALGAWAALLACQMGAHAVAAPKDALPVPRFVSMKHGETNLRVGPGRRYPVEWVYQRKDMPVEVIGEFDVWRKIRDWEGTVGWVVEQAISGRRTALVTGDIRDLHAEPTDASRIVARAEPGVIGALLGCPSSAPDWCRIDAGAAKGWLRRGEIWGVYPQEIVQ